MAEKARVVVASATLPPAAGTTLQWDGRSSMFQDVGPILSRHLFGCLSFRPRDRRQSAPRVSSYLTTDEIRLVPLVPPQRSSMGTRGGTCDLFP